MNKIKENFGLYQVLNKENNYDFNSFDKEVRPYEYYSNLNSNKIEEQICVCSNQELVNVSDEICENCFGVIQK